MVDILYLAKGRPEFTRESLLALDANTNTDYVNEFRFHTDGLYPDAYSLPEDLHDYLWEVCELAMAAELEMDYRALGGPVAIMNDFVSRPGAEFFAKIDNDVIVPPGWLDSAAAVMEQNPRLDILGLEPAFSRNVKTASGLPTAHSEPEGALRCGLCGSDRITVWGYAPDACDDCGAWSAPGGWLPQGKVYKQGVHSRKYYHGYAKVQAVGGVFLARRAAFENRAPMKPYGFNGVGGFTNWQLEHSGARAAAEQRELEVGWIVPPLKLFLLDRLPFEPWASLSRRYIAEGIQRPWANYNGSEQEAGHLYGWWEPAGYPGERTEWQKKTANNPD